MYKRTLRLLQRISLNHKLLLPLAILGGLFAILNTTWNYYQFVHNIRSQVSERARYLTSSIIYISQIEGLEHLERMVFFVGGERDVEDVVLYDAHAQAIIASNHQSWVGHSLEQLHNPMLSQRIQGILQTHEFSDSILESHNSVFYCITTCNIPDSTTVWRPLVIYMKLNIENLEQAEATQQVKDTLLALIGILCIGGIGYILVHVFVIRPLKRIRLTMEARKSGHQGLAPVMYSDEIGDLAHALNAMIVAEEKSQKLFKTLADTAPVLIWMMDTHGNPHYFNPAWLRFTGKSLEVALNQPCSSYLHPEDQSVFTEIYANAIQAPSTLSGEWRLCSHSGTYHWMMYRMVPRLSHEGHLEGYIGVCVDITERKQTERTLQHAHDKALELAKTKSQFLATMSHEVRTPMNGIIGFSNLLRRTELDSRQTEYVEHVQSSARLLLDIMNDILDLSKLEAGKMQLDIHSFDLQCMLQSVFDVFYPQALEKQLHYTLKLHPNIPNCVSGDSTRLRQILMNILGNAIKFTHTGHVQCTCTMPENVLQITIEDTGIGIPNDKLSAIFEPFSQVDTSTTRSYGGTGLGLAIVRNLLEQMGGHITVQSELGIGSIFILQVPLQKDCFAPGPVVDYASTQSESS